jgi:enterochelin esterase-like enzyme
MAFRTIELSDPQFEVENLRLITVKSSNLKGRGDICFFIPDKPGVHNIPLVILLHGVYGSSWAWAFKGGVHRTAQKLIDDGLIQPMVVAMPSDGLWGDGSGYLPHHGLDFENWIVDDVPAAAMEVTSKITANSKYFIAGLSMGGFGALRLGIKYNERFDGVSAHSSITALEQMAGFVEEPLEGFGRIPLDQQSVWETIQSQNKMIPPLRFDCGIDDHLIEFNRKLHHQLNVAGIHHKYQEFPGGHDWSYWQEHVIESLLFFDSLTI